MAAAAADLDADDDDAPTTCQTTVAGQSFFFLSCTAQNSGSGISVLCKEGLDLQHMDSARYSTRSSYSSSTRLTQRPAAR